MTNALFPPDFEYDNPADAPTMAAFTIESAGARLNAIMYIAPGAEAHPTALLLHGYPGNEKNLDVAQALRRAGWNALFFHYRGTWGSEGQFSAKRAEADVHRVLDWLQQEAPPQLRVDRRQLALIGHSFGGYLALMVGANRPEIQHIVSMAGVNLAEIGRFVAQHPEAKETFAAGLDSNVAVQGDKGGDLIGKLVDDPDAYDLLLLLPKLADRRLLLLAGASDAVTPPEIHHEPLVEALTAQSHPALTHHTFFTDHAFSNYRNALCRLIPDWLVFQKRGFLKQGHHP